MILYKYICYIYICINNIYVYIYYLKKQNLRGHVPLRPSLAPQFLTINLWYIAKNPVVYKKIIHSLEHISSLFIYLFIFINHKCKGKLRNGSHRWKLERTNSVISIYIYTHTYAHTRLRAYGWELEQLINRYSRIILTFHMCFNVWGWVQLKTIQSRNTFTWVVLTFHLYIGPSTWTENKLIYGFLNRKKKQMDSFLVLSARYPSTMPSF